MFVNFNLIYFCSYLFPFSDFFNEIVPFFQAASTFSGPTERTVGNELENDGPGLFHRRNNIVKRADDILTNEIDLSLNDIDNAEALKRLKLVQRQAETNNAQQPSSHNNSAICDVIGSFVSQGASTLSAIVNDMTKIFQQLCTSATRAFLHPAQSTSTNSS